MSIDAIAILPPVKALGGAASGEWQEGEGPGGFRKAFRRLSDATLVNLGVSFQAPDADLFDAARQWIGKTPPARVWVFPDTELADEDTAQAVQAATSSAGRWVKAGSAKGESPLEEVGLTRAEVDALKREMWSGDPKRVAAAVASFEKRMEGKDPAELDAVLARFLKRG